MLNSIVAEGEFQSGKGLDFVLRITGNLIAPGNPGEGRGDRLQMEALTSKFLFAC